MFEIKGRISLGVHINGIEFPTERVGVIDYLHMSCSTRIAIPMLDMKLVDTVEWIATKSPLSDGALIQISVSKDGSKRQVYRFRVNSYTPTRIGSGIEYRIDGYLDIPKYWNGSTYKGFNGTSSAALQDIASQCKMAYDGDNTSDSQFWFPSNGQYQKWVQEIAEHGYINSSSCMWRGVDLTNTLIYRDVSQMGGVTTKMSLAVPQQDHVTITDYAPIVDSGSNNHYSGYGDIRVEQTPYSTSGKYRVHDKVTFNKNDEGDMMLNQSIKSTLDQNRVQFGFIDPGNNHADYQRAAYQNSRVTNLFTSGLSVITPESTNVRLLDTVAVSVDQSRQYLRVYAGTYRVASRLIYVVGANYYEKFELMRRTLNTKLPDTAPLAETGVLYKDLT